jgi:transposase-like protein
MTKFQKLGRKRLSIDQKHLILSDHFEKGISLSELARKNQIHPMTIYNWKMSDKKKEDELDIHEIMAENEKLKKENSSLKKSLGSVSHEKEVLKDINDFLKKKYRDQQLKKQKSTSKKKK